MASPDIASIFNDVLNIVKIAKKDPEAPPQAPFGNFIWASYREGVPSELENPLEQQVYDELKSHFLYL